MLEQKLPNNNSLEIIKKTLFSEKIKLKREIKEILLSRGNYSAIVNDCERAYNQVLETMEDYGLIK